MPGETGENFASGLLPNAAVDSDTVEIIPSPGAGSASGRHPVISVEAEEEFGHQIDEYMTDLMTVADQLQRRSRSDMIQAVHMREAGRVLSNHTIVPRAQIGGSFIAGAGGASFVAALIAGGDNLLVLIASVIALTVGVALALPRR